MQRDKARPAQRIGVDKILGAIDLMTPTERATVAKYLQVNTPTIQTPTRQGQLTEYGDCLIMLRSDFEALIAANDQLTAFNDEMSAAMKAFDAIWTNNNRLYRENIKFAVSGESIDLLATIHEKDARALPLLNEALPMYGETLVKEYNAIRAICDEIDQLGRDNPYIAAYAADTTEHYRATADKMGLTRIQLLDRIFDGDAAIEDRVNALFELSALAGSYHPELVEVVARWRAVLTAQEQAEREAKEREAKELADRLKAELKAEENAKHTRKDVSEANEQWRRIWDALEATRKSRQKWAGLGMSDLRDKWLDHHYREDDPDLYDLINAVSRQTLSQIRKRFSGENVNSDVNLQGVNSDVD